MDNGLDSLSVRKTSSLTFGAKFTKEEKAEIRRVADALALMPSMTVSVIRDGLRQYAIHMEKIRVWVQAGSDQEDYVDELIQAALLAQTACFKAHGMMEEPVRKPRQYRSGPVQ